MRSFVALVSVIVVVAAHAVALAGPGDPRLVNGVLEWPRVVTNEPFVLVRGDDGHVYYVAIAGARRDASLAAGGRVSVLGLEGRTPHELTAFGVGVGDSVESALANLHGARPPAAPATAMAPKPNGAPTAPSAASAPATTPNGGAATTPNTAAATTPGAPPQNGSSAPATTPAPAPTAAAPATTAAAPPNGGAVIAPPNGKPAVAPSPSPAAPAPGAATAKSVNGTPAPADAAAAAPPATAAAPPAPSAPAQAAAPSAPSAAPPAAPAVTPPGTGVTTYPNVISVPMPPSSGRVAAAGPPTARRPEASAPTAPVPTSATEDRRWTEITGVVESLVGRTLLLRSTEGRVAVDVSSLSPSLERYLTPGATVRVYGVPVELRFKAMGFFDSRDTRP